MRKFRFAEATLTVFMTVALAAHAQTHLRMSTTTSTEAAE